ncbi:unnamed protein product [Heterosigma akashiwo]
MIAGSQKAALISRLLLLIGCMIVSISGFLHQIPANHAISSLRGKAKLSSLALNNVAAEVGDSIASFIISTPVYGALTNQAKQTMKKSAEAAGVEWDAELERLRAIEDWDERAERVRAAAGGAAAVAAPAYYARPFHTYPRGNTCWDAAFEQELASKAVGVRNFPAEGARGEDVLRGCFKAEMDRMGVAVPPGGRVVDLGCGTGTSARKLAEWYPEAAEVVGVDLSAEMLAVGEHYLRGEAPEARQDRGDPTANARVRLEYADMAATRLPDACADLVTFSLVFHELPKSAVGDCLREARRLLRPGGALAIMEMDPEAPGYIKLRQNPFLYAVLRSTEPYLEEWFNLAPSIEELVMDAGFPVVTKVSEMK